MRCRFESSEARPGVGVYLGGGQLVHAPNTGSVVKIASVNWGKVSGVGRPG